MAVNMGSAVAYLDLDTSKFHKGFSSALGDLKVFGDKSATVGQKLSGLSNTMSTIGSALTLGVTLPLLGVGAMAIKTAMQFESSMSEVKAISGATGSEFEALNQKAIEMGAKTKFSAKESADAFKYMAMAGWDATDMMNGIEGIMNLAAASGEELALTSDIVTDSLTAFGLSAKDSSHFADVLAQASSKSNTNVALMGETFKYAAPVAGALGYSIEDTAVAIGLMANSGIKGSQAGTALRSVFTRLVKPVGEAKDAVEKLGISVTNSDGTMKPLSQTVGELRQKFNTLTDSEKAQYAAMLAGQEGMSGLLAIVNASEADFQMLTSQINNSNGAAEDMAKIMMDNAAGALEQLKGSAESAGIIIGGKLTPYIKKGAEIVQKLTDSFTSLSEEQQDNVVKWALIAAAAGPVILIGSKLVGGLGAVLTAFKFVTTEIPLFTKALQLSSIGMETTATNSSALYRGMDNLKTSFSNLLNPVGLVTAAILLTVGAMVLSEIQKQKEIDKLAELTDAEQATSDKLKELNDSYTTINETREEGIKSAESEAAGIKNLSSRLSEVVDENGRVIAGKETLAQVLVGELSDALGQEVSIIDGQVQKYNELMGSIDETINKKKALAIQAATQEGYTEAVQKQTEYQVLYNEKLTQTIEAEEKHNEAVKKATKQRNIYNEMFENGLMSISDVDNAMRSLDIEVEASSKKFEKMSEELSETEKAMVGYNQTVENYEGLSAALISGSAEEIEMALLKVQQGFLTAGTATRESLEKQNETINEQYDKMVKALADGVPGVTKQMVDNIKVLAQQSNEELKLKLEMDKETLKTQFHAVGIEAPQELINALVEKDPETTKTAINVLTNMQNGSKVKADDIKFLFNTLGIEAPSELIKQLASKEPSVQAQGISLLQQLQNAETTKRPAIVSQLRDLGFVMDNNLADSIQSNTGVVIEQAGTLGDKANKEIATKVKPNVDAPDINAISNASAEAERARGSMQDVFNSPIYATISATVSAVVGKITGSIFGSHKDGLDYVPYDGYVAELHRGERVLTEQENTMYNRGTTKKGNNVGDVYNFYNTKPDPYEYGRQMKKAKKELLEGF